MNKAEALYRDTVRESRDGAARDEALRAAAGIAIEPASRVPYRSQGRLLVIGAATEALAIGSQLKAQGLHCFVLAQGEGIGGAGGEVPVLFISRRLGIRLSGHLGEFTVKLVSGERGEIDLAEAMGADFVHFDLILDLGTPSLLNWEVLPLGYYAPRGDEARLAQILAELPTLAGEFEKAKFFRYDSDICAHGDGNLQGCRRCLEACPTGAISSGLDKIAVDPYLCQGVGSCATACPTGAIIYTFPKPADTLNRLRILLRTYAEAGGCDPILLFNDSASGRQRLEQPTDQMPNNVIAIEVEEVGSMGMEVWLAALAYGASQVLILVSALLPPSVLREIREQMGFAQLLLEGMGYAKTVLRLLDAGDDQIGLAEPVAGPSMPVIRRAGFAGGNAKRDNLFSAIDWLAAQATSVQTAIPMPRRAPFGEIQVDRSACTLCMACVSVCPASALFDGVDVPRLEFLEANCVQCGLCERACPEDAITLHARFLFDSQQRRQQRLLHEEEALRCLSCGKPFATRSMIEKIAGKLSGHRMFQDEPARRRLQMCGECRVRDMFGG